MVVLNPDQVPDQPADRVGVALDPVGELVDRKALDRRQCGLSHALESIGSADSAMLIADTSASGGGHSRSVGSGILEPDT